MIPDKICQSTSSPSGQLVKALDCQTEGREFESHSRATFCYRCQKQGHIAKNCLELLGETSNYSEKAQSARSYELRNSERSSEARNSEAKNTEPRNLEVQDTTPQTEGASARSSQTGASSSGNSEGNLRQSRAPVSVKNNAKKMI